MSLNYETFREEAMKFIEISNSLNDRWGIISKKDEPLTMYLVKKTIVQDPLGNNEEDSVPLLLTYEFHIVYSSSYNVPVLYFNVYKQDGSLLKLEEIWDRVPKLYSTQLEYCKWSMLTQQEHPILGRPFYTLHPCNTKELMGQLNLNGANYLISWLSSVGPVIGLKIDPKYALHLNKFNKNDSITY